MVRVRVSPSPTGMAHIGTAYISLFNFAFARKHGGKFILRLEDTDQERHVAEAEEVLYKALSWLGLDPDESPTAWGDFGPYRQSERLKLYQEAAKKLVTAGRAKEKEGAVWITPNYEVYGWDDMVRGQIEFKRENLKEWVILRSSGWPTYNFAAAVDDAEMKISHVIRGEDHISNTPLQLSAYRAMGVEPPMFGHLPLLRGKDHSKLSKRKDPVSLDWYREQGYLAEAMINFLGLQGWSHPLEKDIFSLEEFIKEMSLERVKTSAPVFDFKKLDWINGQYIQKMKDEDLVDLLRNFWDDPRRHFFNALGSESSLPSSSPLGQSKNKVLHGSSSRVSKMSPSDHPDSVHLFDKDLIVKTVPLVKERIKKLSEFPELVSYFRVRPTVDRDLVLKQSNLEVSVVKKIFEQIISAYENLGNWDVQNLEKAGHELLNITKLSPKELFMTIRVAISGRTATPPLVETMAVLGKKEVVARLKAADRIVGGEAYGGFIGRGVKKKLCSYFILSVSG